MSDATPNDPLRAFRRTIGRIFLFSFIVLVAVGIFTHFGWLQPEKYFCSRVAFIDAVTTSSRTPRTILADPVTHGNLLAAVDRLDLAEKGDPSTKSAAREKAARLLKERVFFEFTGTTPFHVACYHVDRKLAADIANAVLEAERERRKADVDSLLAEQRTELENKMAEVRKMYETADSLRKKYSIQDPSPEESVLGITVNPSADQTDATSKIGEYTTTKARYIGARLLQSALQQRYDAARFDALGITVRITEQAIPSTDLKPGFTLPGKVARAADKSYFLVVCGFTAGLALAYALLLGNHPPHRGPREG